MSLFFQNEAITVHQGDALTELRKLPSESVHCCVTSPPFWGLRDYSAPLVNWEAGSFVPMLGCAAVSYPAWRGQLGLEPDPMMFVGHIVQIFEEVRRVLTPSGTCWVEFGDVWISDGGAGKQGRTGQRVGRRHTQESLGVAAINGTPRGGMKGPQKAGMVLGLKPKDMAGMPWRVAYALQAAGWWLRQDNIWHKPNVMPGSAKDRPTTAHTHVFFFSKSERYFYDNDSVKEPVTGRSHRRSAAASQFPGDANRDANRRRPGVNPKAVHAKFPANWAHGPGDHSAIGHTRGRIKQNASFAAAVVNLVDKRNLRSVWTIATSKFEDAHFATFPPKLPEICIKAGSPVGGVVLDPFLGAWTTLLVAQNHGRKGVGLEISPKYNEMGRRRVALPLFDVMSHNTKIEHPEPEGKPVDLFENSAQVEKSNGKAVAV